jgi:hypothetical protein
MKMNVKVNLQGLEKLKQIAPNIVKYETHIGFLGEEKNTRTETGLTNANLAALHHFGSRLKNLPVRSPFVGFFMEDKTRNITEVVKKSLSSALDKAPLKEANIEQALKRGGLAGENLIDDTFATEGFGFWPKIKSETVAKKGNNKILIDTGQLQASRASKVIKK